MTEFRPRTTFDVQPVDRFAGKSAAIKRPREIGFFSYDDEHRFRLDDSSLRYYYAPSLPADLNAGFETFRQRDETEDEHLDSLLETIIDLEQKTGQRCDADIVTWRGMMTRIMAAPFDRFNSFTMNATNYQGTVFIEEDHQSSLAEKQQRPNRPPVAGRPSPEMMAYWGYKFETLSVIPDIWDRVSRDEIEGRPDDRVSNLVQHCSIVRTGIGDTSLVLGGEVDAIWDRRPDSAEDPIDWVELKTSETPRTDADMLKFERKLLKFWAQSFLLGVPRILVGFRSPDGILESLEELRTQSIPGNVKRAGKNSWDGNTCINFTAAFLDLVRHTVTCSGIWRITRNERSPVIEICKVAEQGSGRILSPAFIKHREQMMATQVAEMLKGPLKV